MHFEPFLGRHPSHFKLNSIIRTFIISEAFLWSGWNFFFPIVAVFVVENVNGGNVEVAAAATSFYLISRILFELISGKYLVRSNDRSRLMVAIVGNIVLCFAYLAFIVAGSVSILFFVYMIMGAGLGIASPAKNSLFSTHLDRDKEAYEWSFYDAVTFSGMALAGILGGVIAQNYGFQIVFVVAALLNLIGVLPYFFLLGRYSAKES